MDTATHKVSSAYPIELKNIILLIILCRSTILLEFLKYTSIAETMKRPSNLILAFVGGIATIFFIFALGRIAVFVFPPTNSEVEVENNYLIEE